jgi:transposase
MEKTVNYLGIDVHSAASIWCLLDPEGETVATGRSETTFPALRELASGLRGRGDLVAGQEVGTQCYLVADAFRCAGVPIQSFNAAHLRMIAASRKKTDRRDAYWIARSIQTGMAPHPVYLPTGEVRELRRFLQRRRIVVRDRNRWRCRARATLRSEGLRARTGGASLNRFMNQLIERPDGVDTNILESLGLAQRFITLLDEELAHIEAMMHVRTKDNEVIDRLQTIPGIGPICATTLYATIGDIQRFPNARHLGSYAGLVPSVRQSGETNRHGHITRQGSKYLRSVLVQSAHVATKCNTPRAEPLRALYQRIRGSRGRRKIALTAVARHLLRVAFYVWRDGAKYDPNKLRCRTD